LDDRLRPIRNSSNKFKTIGGVDQALFRISAISLDIEPKSVALIRAFHPNEGRIAIATNAGWNAMDADMSQGVRR
jgi:hypothetical protein